MQTICFITSLKSNCLCLLKWCGQQAFSFQLILLRPEIKTASNSISQQNSLGNRTKIVKERRTKNARMKQSNDFTCKRTTIPSRKTLHAMSLFTTKEKIFTQHGPCAHARQPQLIQQPEHQIRCPKVKLWTIVFRCSKLERKKKHWTNQSSKPRSSAHACENQGQHITNRTCKAQTGKVVYVALAPWVSSYKWAKWVKPFAISGLSLT